MRRREYVHPHKCKHISNRHLADRYFYAGEQIGQEVLEREDAAKEELTAEGVTFVDVDNAAFTEHFSGYAEANFPDLADWCNQIRALAPNA